MPTEPPLLPREPRAIWTRLTSEYAMALVLLLLCLYFTIATWGQMHPEGAAAGRAVARQLPAGATVAFVAAETGNEGQLFITGAREHLASANIQTIAAYGAPSDVKEKLEEAAKSGRRIDAILLTRRAAEWPWVERISAQLPQFASTPVISPQPYKWARFLSASNFAAMTDRIVVIAILAIGMTLVIVTGGIDLSVGSLIAVGAVVSTKLIHEWAGGPAASSSTVALCCAGAILVCACSGLFSGLMITRFAIPPFIVTLSMMLIGTDIAYELSNGLSFSNVPASFKSLGQERCLGIPNTILLLIGLYAAATVLMNYTLLGRYIYAVGGNKKAAHLSGVPTKKVIVIVYTLCGALAGLGGIVEASKLGSGGPQYGAMAELSVIAAVVVGGASLNGGKGNILSTLLGVLVIGVIQNGMNLVGVTPFRQQGVLGAVILGAVLLDRLRNPQPTD